MCTFICKSTPNGFGFPRSNPYFAEAAKDRTSRSETERGRLIRHTEAMCRGPKCGDFLLYLCRPPVVQRWKQITDASPRQIGEMMRQSKEVW